MKLKNRMLLLATLDSVIVLFSIFVGYFLLHPTINPFKEKILLVSSLTFFFAHHVSAMYYGLYRKVWEYASIGELTSIFKAVTYSIFIVAIVQFIFIRNIMFTPLMITWMLHLLLIGGSRISWRMFRDKICHKSCPKNQKRTLIIGAGSTGSMIVRQLQRSNTSRLKPVAFLDDDPSKVGLEVLGIRVLGGRLQLKQVIESFEVEHILIAIPSMNRKDLANLSQQCLATGIKTQTVPLIDDLLTGEISIKEIRDVNIEDLLGREEIKLDMKTVSNKLTEQIVLVTGAGGSIGSEICRQVMNFKPKQLLLLGHGENSIYNIYMELKGMETVQNGQTELVEIIADIRDRNRIFDIINNYRPNVIYHAAAHKHVPLMEDNPMEAVKNNIFGTKNVAEAAHTFNVRNFVMISTDKAVNPPNIMGATKRFAEMIVQNLAQESKTKFAAVRFGNVLGSRGSVIPLFKKQIAKGGPVTVTDERMTRYFMTIPEAARLVIQAGSLAEGGEVFVLDMGEPVKIVDLAKNLIRLTGYSEADIPIEYTGVRPGEKLYEELLNDNEIQQEKVFPKIHIGKAEPMEKENLYAIAESLSHMSQKELKQTLLNIANTKYGKSDSLMSIS
ncbi:polysaccharide biosynthesis protein [Rummeliibacillus sp. JY-2-4R]